MTNNAQDSQRYNELIRRMQQRKQKMKQTLNQGNNQYRSGGFNQYTPKDNNKKLGNFVTSFPRSSKNQRQANNGQQRYFGKIKEQTQQQQKNYTQTRSQEKVPTFGKRERERRRKTEQCEELANSQQYRQLHEKLDYIQQKIGQMKSNLQKKRQQKKKNYQTKKVKKMQKKKLLLEDQEILALNGAVVQMPEHENLHPFNKNPYSPKHNIYYVSEIVKAYLDQGSLARQHIFTSLQILQMLQKVNKPKDSEIAHRKVHLPKRKGYQNKKTVVFDLDQTLIHCNENLTIPYDARLPITFPNGEVIQAGINIRPYTFQIIQQLAKNFQIIVFTASHSCYANVVLDYLDKQSRYIHHRLFRQHCYETPQGVYIKDLRVINRQLSDMVLVDNAAYSYAFQLQNGIPIIPYYHGTTDYQLKALQKYIQSMIFHKDVRETNKKTFKLHQYKNYYLDPIQLVQDLYIPEHQHHHN